jgi:hypothetical protein
MSRSNAGRALRLLRRHAPLIPLVAALWCSPPMLARAQVVAEPTGSVRVELALKGPVTAPLEGELTFTPTGSHVAPIVMPLHGQAAAATLPTGSTWEVSVSIPGYWGRRESIAVSSERPVVQRLALWPLGKITGGVDPTSSVKEISVVTLAPRQPVPKDDFLRGSLTCPVEAAGRWTCQLPASTFDFVIAAKGRGLAPTYRLGVKVPAADTLDLGLLEFSRGASIAGLVEVDQGTVAPGQCVARLSVLADPGAPSLAPIQVQVSPEGFFQLTAIPTGKYLLEIEQPGYTPARLSPVTVSSSSSAQFFEHTLVLHPLPPQSGDVTS